MAISESLINRCSPEQHRWHLWGNYTDEGNVIGELDIELEKRSYTLGAITFMAKDAGLSSWRLKCNRCDYTKIYGTFLLKRE